MTAPKVYRAIGLMSGTSLDGVDIALIETDGYAYVKPLDFKSYPYDEPLKAHVKSFFGKPQADQKAIDLITDAHIAAIKDFGHTADLIGFHGQTIFHDPDQRMTVQIGDGERLARETGMNVVYDMRSADIAAGGQGAPLLPLYHRARILSDKVKLPAVIINIGGVANITWVNGPEDGQILAFDCGTGNALMDDYMREYVGQDYDRNGQIAAQGNPHPDIIGRYLSDPFFAKLPPKSLDRDRWNIDPVRELSLEDAVCTLLGVTVKTIQDGFKFLPQKPKSVFVAGGGRHNAFLMRVLPMRLPKAFWGKFAKIDTLKWNGDAIEAEGFAYLAVRSLLGEPLSLPMTTGVPAPQTGGKLIKFDIM